MSDLFKADHRIRENDSEEKQQNHMDHLKRRTLSISEAQPRQNLIYFKNKLKNLEFRSTILHDRIVDVMNKLEQLDLKMKVQSKIGMGRYF